MTEGLQKFAGKWKMDRSENIEEFFKAMGMNFFLRKMAMRASPEQDVSIEGEVMKTSIHTAFMTRDDEVKLNQEYEKHNEKMGVTFRVKAREEDGKIIIEQEAIKGGTDKMKHQLITRELINKETVITIQMGDLVCKRWFKKME